MHIVHLITHFVEKYPKLDLVSDEIDGFDIVYFMDEGCIVIDPIEMEHRGISGYFGPHGLTKADAQIISDYNADYSKYLCS